MPTKKKASLRLSDRNQADPLKTILQTEMIKGIHRNLAQDVTLISEGNLGSILSEHWHPADRWRGLLGNFGVLLTLLTTLATANFHDFLGLKSGFWWAFFIFLAGISTASTIRSLWIGFTRKYPSPIEIGSQIHGTSYSNNIQTRVKLNGDSDKRQRSRRSKKQVIRSRPTEPCNKCRKHPKSQIMNR